MSGATASDAAARSLESAIARLLTIGTYVSVALLAVGTVLLIGGGHSPLDAAPPLDLRQIPAQLVALDPAGFLWLGVIGMIATPASRVVAALVGFARAGDRRMAVVAALILVVIAVGVAAGTAAG